MPSPRITKYFISHFTFCCYQPAVSHRIPVLLCHADHLKYTAKLRRLFLIISFAHARRHKSGLSGYTFRRYITHFTEDFFYALLICGRAHKIAVLDVAVIHQFQFLRAPLHRDIGVQMLLPYPRYPLQPRSPSGACRRRFRKTWHRRAHCRVQRWH